MRLLRDKRGIHREMYLALTSKPMTIVMAGRSLLVVAADVVNDPAFWVQSFAPYKVLELTNLPGKRKTNENAIKRTDSAQYPFLETEYSSVLAFQNTYFSDLIAACGRFVPSSLSDPIGDHYSFRIRML